MILWSPVIIFSLTVNLIIVNQVSSEPLNNLPWKFGQGDWIINATLTRDFSDERYSMVEYIHSDSDGVRGKIVITPVSGKSSVEVFYSSSFKEQRLVISDNKCEVYTFSNFWSKSLFDLTAMRSLQNHLLLTGPSILLRLNSKNLFWNQGPDTMIRGINVQSVNTTLDRELNIIYYNKNSHVDGGLLEAIRLKFLGYDPGTQVTTYAEGLHFDIYSFSTTTDLSKFVTVTTGVGCPSYLVDRKVSSYLYLPHIMGANIHYIAKETIDGPTKSITMNEVYLSSKYQIARLKSKGQGITTESIYDYNLGIAYTSKKEGECSISAIDSKSFGITANGHFSTYQPFNMEDYHYMYVGKVDYERKPGLTVDVWEVVNYDYVMNGIKYDRVVITQYFSPQADSRLFNDNILMGTTIKTYNKITNESYQLIETTTRDYYDSEVVDEYDLRLKVEDCYPNADERKLIALHFKCVKSSDCQKVARDEYHQIQEKIRHSINNLGISVARIIYIDIVFNGDEIIAYTEFMKIPDIKLSLQSQSLKIDRSTFSKVKMVNANSEEDCLERQVAGLSRLEAIIYSDHVGENSCGRVESKSSIKEDKKNGNSFNVYDVSLSKLMNYNREIPLDKLEENLNRARISFTLDGEPITYMMEKAIDMSTSEYLEGSPYELIDNGGKLIADNINVLMVNEVNNFGDCYRACAHSEENSCETFSFCQYSDKPTCLTSNSLYSDLSAIVTQDNSCKTLRKNRLLDYAKVPSRRYKHPTSIATDNWVEDCASACSSSDECFSFQHCSGSCTFGGYYTDSSSEKSDDCDIYIPKVSQQYKLTGRKIVSETFHTELNLDYAQCASLCAGWTNGDEVCVSFNFCPKSSSTTSTCSLTKYSISDPMTESIKSNTCQNYEFNIEDLMKAKQKSSSYKVISTSGTSGKGAFGIVILFVMIGLIAGLITPMTVMKINNIWRTMRAANQESTFNWSRYENDEDDQQSAV